MPASNSQDNDDQSTGENRLALGNLGSHEILIKVAVATHLSSYGCAGVVVDQGSQVNTYRQYERVMCSLTLPSGEIPQYVRVNAQTITRLPKELFFLDAAVLACAGHIWQGLHDAKLQTSQWLAIVSSGDGIVNLAVQFAKVSGLRVIVIGPPTLASAQDMNADYCFNVYPGDESIRNVKNVTDGYGADATINLSDDDSAAALACALTRTNGIMIQIAQPNESVIPTQELTNRKIRVTGSLGCSTQESNNMVDSFLKNNMKTRVIPIYGVENFEDLTGLYKRLGRAYIAVVEAKEVWQDEIRNAEWTIIGGRLSRCLPYAKDSRMVGKCGVYAKGEDGEWRLTDPAHPYRDPTEEAGIRME